MKLKNTTDDPKIPDRTIRLMTSYCCRILGMPADKVTDLTVRNRSDGDTSGRCWLRTGRIVVSVGYVLGDKPGPARVPAKDWWGGFRCVGHAALERRVEKLLRVLAHEVAHRFCYLTGTAKGPRNRRPGECEKTTQWHANLVMAAYEKNKQALLDYWLRQPAERVVADKPDKRRVRAQKDAQLLRTWERKKALASTKVTKYKRKVARAKREGLLD